MIHYPIESLLHKNRHGKSILLLLRQRKERKHLKYLLQKIWNNFDYRMCADGAANKLRKINLLSPTHPPMIPDLITGDLDSINKETIQYFEKNENLYQLSDQNLTDFRKCINIILTSLTKNYSTYMTNDDEQIISISKKVSERITLKSEENNNFIWISVDIDNHRIDQLFGLFHDFYAIGRQIDEMKEKGIILPNSHINIYLISYPSIILFLTKNENHEIFLERKLIQNHCGLTPMKGEATVTTKGFKWNCSNTKLEYGGALISVSNQFDETFTNQEKTIQKLEVRSDNDLLLFFTFNFDDILDTNNEDIDSIDD
ncbi:hypothetical protein SNEBB_005428 [Seison nebaliae]|nr:hypothetical protein SNEBB_005428 [Seison nebaliae]